MLPLSRSSALLLLAGSAAYGVGIDGIRVSDTELTVIPSAGNPATGHGQRPRSRPTDPAYGLGFSSRHVIALTLSKSSIASPHRDRSMTPAPTNNRR